VLGQIISSDLFPFRKPSNLYVVEFGENAESEKVCKEGKLTVCLILDLAFAASTFGWIPPWKAWKRFAS